MKSAASAATASAFIALATSISVAADDDDDFASVVAGVAATAISASWLSPSIGAWWLVLTLM